MPKWAHAVVISNIDAYPFLMVYPGALVNTLLLITQIIVSNIWQFLQFDQYIDNAVIFVSRNPFLNVYI